MRKKIAVFCASAKATQQSLLESAYEIGYQLSSAGFDLVWGGCSSASMGRVAEGFKDGGGHLTGFIPQHFIDAGAAFYDIDQLIVVQDLQERKLKMRQAADGFLVLPGGFGTLDELFDILAVQIIAAQRAEATKPIVIHNPDYFFRYLELFINQLYRTELAPDSYRRLYSFVESSEQVILTLKRELIL